MNPERIEFLGLPLSINVSKEGICGLIQQKGAARLINSIHPGAWAVAKNRPEYLDYLQQMNFVLSDSWAVAAACRLLTGHDCQRLSFDMTSLADDFFKTAVAAGATIMLVGGQPAVDENMQTKLQNNYKGIKIITTSHGFGELSQKVALVMKNNPDIVIAGMGAPRQESFLVALRDAGYKGLGITCGGFFDQYLLADDYYPKWIDKHNLRFLWRLYMEPQRLWKRYLIDYQLFIWRVMVAAVEKAKSFVKR